ncbi:MAG: hypothetical protein Q8R28_15470 [Dehalococcoidia bacterium]|nr:hypothetical protein [Dehalococcoidia bacterium]
MGSDDRRLLLREIAELLAYARTPGFDSRETQTAIYEGVHERLEQVKDDVDESADALEENFPDRADTLRDDWQQWVEDVQGSVEEIQANLEDKDWDEDPVSLADDIENEMERTETPRRNPPSLEELVGPVATGESRRADEVAQAWPILQRIRDAMGGPAGPPTWLDILNARGRHFITVDEAKAALRAMFVLLNKTSMDEFTKFFQHEITPEDLDKFVRNQAATEEELKPWREAIVMRGTIRM